MASGCGSADNAKGPPAGRPLVFPSLTAHLPARQPNVVVVMTDDQRADDLSVMPAVRRELARHGTTFANNFATYPLCCPSRTTFMTGEYAHNHGILTNDAPDGGYVGYIAHVDQRRTIGAEMQSAGYRTGYVGKFLNEYAPEDPATDMPRGWDVFDGLFGPTEYLMYGWSANENGTMVQPPAGPADYQTTALANLAAGFIRQSAGGPKPFFLTYAPTAPHNAPVVPGQRNPQPAPQDESAFEHRPLPRPPSFEAPITGEPQRLRAPQHADRPVAAIASAYRDRLASLLAVDRGVGSLVDTLRSTGELHNTVFVFTSDNGFLLGEHRAAGKERPYEESVKVPLVIRGPGFPAGVVRDQLVGNMDLMPTILSLARAPWRRGTDGVSLVAQANDPSAWSRRPILYEGAAVEGLGYHSIRTPRYVYTHYLNGAQELFDLQRDPGELHNVAHDPTYSATLDALRPLLVQLAKCSGDSCRRPLPAIPGPPG